MAKVGERWLRGDALEAIEHARGRLADGCPLPAVAQELRLLAELLDLHPTAYIHAIVRDAAGESPRPVEGTDAEVVQLAGRVGSGARPPSCSNLSAGLSETPVQAVQRSIEERLPASERT